MFHCWVSQGQWFHLTIVSGTDQSDGLLPLDTPSQRPSQIHNASSVVRKTEKQENPHRVWWPAETPAETPAISGGFVQNTSFSWLAIVSCALPFFCCFFRFKRKQSVPEDCISSLVILKLRTILTKTENVWNWPNESQWPQITLNCAGRVVLERTSKATRIWSHRAGDYASIRQGLWDNGCFITAEGTLLCFLIILINVVSSPAFFLRWKHI